MFVHRLFGQFGYAHWPLDVHLYISAWATREAATRAVRVSAMMRVVFILVQKGDGRLPESVEP